MSQNLRQNLGLWRKTRKGERSRGEKDSKGKKDVGEKDAREERKTWEEEQDGDER